jgi:hypothetical protein
VGSPGRAAPLEGTGLMAWLVTAGETLSPKAILQVVTDRGLVRCRTVEQFYC